MPHPFDHVCAMVLDKIIVICSCIAQLAVAVLKEFREMLHKQATVEAFIEWLDVSVEQKIIKVCITVVHP